MGILMIFFLIGIVALVLLVFLTVRKNVFTKESPTFQKLFFGFLAIATLTCGQLGYMSLAVLNRSDLRVADKINDFERYDNFLESAVQISFIALLILANWAYFRHLRLAKWAFLIALGFFSSFVLFDYIFIAEIIFHFKKENGFWKGGFSIAGLAGLLLCLVAALFVIANFWLNGILIKRMESAANRRI